MLGIEASRQGELDKQFLAYFIVDLNQIITSSFILTHY